MPSDIVAWLRAEAELVALPRLAEAAAEIERLRAEKITGLTNILTSAADEKLLRATILQCYGERATAFHVSKEHYRYLAEQIIALREAAKRAEAEIERLRATLQVEDEYDPDGLKAEIERLRTATD